MRITFVLPPDSLSGGVRVVSIYAEKLTRRGHMVSVVQPRHARPTFRDIVRSLRHGKGWPKDRDGGPSFFDGLAVERVKLKHAGGVTAADVPDGDVVVATWWETAEWVAALPASKGSKAYFIQHHEVHMDHQPVDRVDATWKLPLKKIVIAPWLEALSHERFGDDDVVVVPNAADTALFFAAARGTQSVPTVGFMYSPVKFKGVDIAIAAIERARKELPELRVVAFGSSKPTLALPLPARAEFEFCPAQEALRTIYASCDAWLFASRVEGFGLPILEAMACRTPVIGTPAGAAPELLARGGGMLVPMEDAEAMAAAIVRMARLPEEGWKAMSDAAYATATGYSWDDATDKFEAALEQVQAGASAAHARLEAAPRKARV